MECLVKVYNGDPINNLISIFSFNPEKVIFLYDNDSTSQKDINNIVNACKAKFCKMKFESIPINAHNIDKIYRICKRLVQRNPNCFFDITGSSEMCAIAVHLSCKNNFTPIFSIDIKNGTLINIYGCNYLVDQFKLPKLSIESILLSHGATLSGNNHPKPSADIFDDILEFCNLVFQDTLKWKDLCLYIQMALSSTSTEYKLMNFSAPREIKSPTISIKLNDTALLTLAENIGFINNLYIDNQKVSFSFENDIIKRYMTDFGTWLELYTFIKIKREPMFNDVRISTKIDWDPGKKNITEITNEIDVTFFYGIHAVFISCKLSEPSTDALQELTVYSNYLGGKYSKCVLVTLATIKKERSHIIARADEMGISIIDGKTIRNGDFMKNLKEILDI